MNRLATRTVTGVVAGMVAATATATAVGFWLSYDGLHVFALRAGLHGPEAWAWPASSWPPHPHNKRRVARAHGRPEPSPTTQV